MSNLKDNLRKDYRGAKEKKVWKIGNELIRQADQVIKECQIEALEVVLNKDGLNCSAVSSIQERVSAANVRKEIGKEILNLLGEESRAEDEKI